MKLKEVRKPTLQAALGLDWVLSLNEVLNTRFSDEAWEQVGASQVGTATLGDETFQIFLEPRTYRHDDATYSFINVAFAKLVDGAPAQQLQWHSTNASQVVGAISNALHDRVQLYDFDAVVFVAADAVEKRMQVYNAVARHKWKGLGTVVENVDIGGGRLLTALLSKRLTGTETEGFIDHLKKLRKA